MRPELDALLVRDRVCGAAIVLETLAEVELRNADRQPVDFDGLTRVAKITASGASPRTLTPGNLPEAG